MTDRLTTICALGLAAMAVPLFAIYVQYHAVHVTALAEDDCAPYYGVYALDEVVGFDIDGHHFVDCVYR